MQLAVLAVIQDLLSAEYHFTGTLCNLDIVCVTSNHFCEPARIKPVK